MTPLESMALWQRTLAPQGDLLDARREVLREAAPIDYEARFEAELTRVWDGFEKSDVNDVVVGEVDGIEIYRSVTGVPVHPDGLSQMQASAHPIYALLPGRLPRSHPRAFYDANALDLVCPPHR